MSDNLRGRSGSGSYPRFIGGYNKANGACTNSSRRPNMTVRQVHQLRAVEKQLRAVVVRIVRGMCVAGVWNQLFIIIKMPLLFRLHSPKRNWENVPWILHFILHTTVTNALSISLAYHAGHFGAVRLLLVATNQTKGVLVLMQAKTPPSGPSLKKY